MKQNLEELLTPVVEDLGYVLWGCEYLPQGKYAILRLYIDAPEGVGIEDCEKVSRQVSAVLDVEDPISSHYTLEVSSPGVPKPLFHLWQYERYIGQAVHLKTHQPIGGKRKLTGTILEVTEDSVKLDVELTQEDISFSNIVKAYLTV